MHERHVLGFGVLFLSEGGGADGVLVCAFLGEGWLKLVRECHRLFLFGKLGSLDSEHGKPISCEPHVFPPSSREGEHVPRLDDLLPRREVVRRGVRVDEPLGEGLGVFVLPRVVRLFHGIQRVMALLRLRGRCESPESLRGVDELGAR